MSIYQWSSETGGTSEIEGNTTSESKSVTAKIMDNLSYFKILHLLSPPVK